MTAQIRLGTSSFTADGWNGAFYPKGMKSADYLRYYSGRFDTVEVDSTFYRCPTMEAVHNWALKTPPGFIFSLKVPRTITHEKVLAACDKEFEEEGAVLAIRNPGGHSFPEGPEQRAVEYICFLSLLAYRVEEAKKIR
jgi:uncharacterized protein YecE (DUF72 family)